MVDIRVKDLPLGTANASKLLAMDLTTTERATIKDIVFAGRPAASQAEAEAGVNAEKVMTPLTSKQALLAQAGTTFASAVQGGKADTALQPSYENSVSCADYGALPDCTDQGVGTDLAPAFAAAFEAAITNIGDGATIIIPSGRYRWATPVVLDGMGKHNVKIICYGTITPDDMAMYCCTLRNLINPDIEFEIYKGGRYSPVAGNYGYYADYTQADVISEGGQVFLRVQGVFNYRTRIKQFAYAGRGLHIGTRVDELHPQTGAAKIWIVSGRDASDGSVPRCAQTMYGETSVLGQGNFGWVECAFSDFDLWGGVIEDWNDTSIGEVDGASFRTGFQLRGCVVVSIENYYWGSIDSGDPYPGGRKRHIELIPSASRDTKNVTINKFRCLDDGDGAYLKNVKDTTILSMEGGADNADYFIEIENCQNVKIKGTYRGGLQAVRITGANTDQIFVDMVAFGLTDNHIHVTSEVNGAVFLSGLLVGAAATKSLIKVDGTAKVFVDNMLLYSDSGAIFDVVAGNEVHVRNAYINGIATLYKTAPTRTALNISGGAIESRLEFPMQIAGNSVWAPPSSFFNSSATGSRQLPDGTIEKWGVASGSAGDIVVTYATPFPTKVLGTPQVTMIGGGIGTGSIISAFVENVTASGFTIKRRFQTGTTTGQAAESCGWRVIGH